VADGLDVIAVWIAKEGTVVVGMVLRPQLGRMQHLCASCHPRVEEGLDGGAVGGGERDVGLTEAVTGVTGSDPEVRIRLYSVTDDVPQVHDPPSAQWSEDSVVEGGAGRHIGALDGKMIEHDLTLFIATSPEEKSKVVIAERLVAGALEPVVGQVYFSPECHALYEGLGFGASPAKMGDVALPDGPAYFCSRGSVMGQVPGELVAAAFAVFKPGVVVPAVAHGWKLTDAVTICEARTVGAIGQLRRILGERPPGLARATELLLRANEGLRPEGRALYAGVLSLGLPGDPIGDMWRLGDLLREYRGDSHTASWVSAGFDATEIGLLTELYWGLPLRTYVRSRAWSDADLDAAEARLTERCLIVGGAFTDEGRAAREAVESATDRACSRIVTNLGDDLGELVEILNSWSGGIQAAGGYPGRGPHDLARFSR
jgi:hypothetical protein